MFEERIWTKKSSQKCEAWLQRSQKCEAWLQNNCWKATLGILFRESLNNLNEKILIKIKFEYIELSTKKIFTFFFTSFQILNCYIIVYYDYLLLVWVVMNILFS